LAFLDPDPYSQSGSVFPIRIRIHNTDWLCVGVPAAGGIGFRGLYRSELVSWIHVYRYKHSIVLFSVNARLIFKKILFIHVHVRKTTSFSFVSILILSMHRRKYESTQDLVAMLKRSFLMVKKIDSRPIRIRRNFMYPEHGNFNTYRTAH
jgi:hypothetical protein